MRATRVSSRSRFRRRFPGLFEEVIRLHAFGGGTDVAFRSHALVDVEDTPPAARLIVPLRKTLLTAMCKLLRKPSGSAGRQPAAAIASETSLSAPRSEIFSGSPGMCAAVSVRRGA